MYDWKSNDDMQLVAAGMEFPDASARVALALSLDREEVEDMERDYDECC